MARPDKPCGWPFPTRPPADRAGWLSSPCWRDPADADPTRSMSDTRPRRGAVDRSPMPAEPAPTRDQGGLF